MHPEIEKDEPGDCPICGMALEPVGVAVEEDTAELDDMTRRFGWSLGFTVPVVAIAMGDLMLPGTPVSSLIGPQAAHWLELVLSLPVCLWAAWPFYQRAINTEWPIATASAPRASALATSPPLRIPPA